MADPVPPATVTLEARCCPACRRLRTYCRCATGAGLRERVDAVREDAAAERRRRLAMQAEVDAARAEQAARRRRIVYRTAEQLELLP